MLSISHDRFSPEGDRGDRAILPLLGNKIHGRLGRLGRLGGRRGRDGLRGQGGLDLRLRGGGFLLASAIALAIAPAVAGNGTEHLLCLRTVAMRRQRAI